MKNNDAQELNLQLNPELFKPLFTMKPLVHGAAIIFNWLIIIGMAYLSIQLSNILVYFIALLVIGARMHALAILMHDASHFRFMKNRKWNDLITNFTTMYFLFLTIEQYRTNHLAHHKHLNTDHDPDWVSKFQKKEFTFPQTKQDFFKTIASYFLLIQGIKDAFWFVRRFGLMEGKKKTNRNDPKLPKALFYITLIGVLTYLGWWTYFLLYWVVPYFSTFLMFQYIRSVAEHFGELAYDSELTGSRTVKTNFIERFLIAPHNVGYHLEHHLYPGVPYYNLPKLHELLMEDATFKDNAHITHGYWSGLIKEIV